jgi:hypothetical protein
MVAIPVPVAIAVAIVGAMLPAAAPDTPAAQHRNAWI